MKPITTTTSGAAPDNYQKAAHLFKQVIYGQAAIRIVDGVIASDLPPKIRYKRKPRSPRCVPIRDPPTTEVKGFRDAVRDFLQDIRELKGTWEVTVQIADTMPIYWEREEVRPLPAPLNN